MKLFELDDLAAGEDYATGRLTNQELQIAYKKLLQKEMTKEEIADFAQEMTGMGEFTRTQRSAYFLLSRMHILLHGIAPEGEPPSTADVMFNIPNTMFAFVIRQGDLDAEDLGEYVRQAKKEMMSRPDPRKRRKRNESLQIMGQFYKENKARIGSNVQQGREQILQSLDSGASPEEAFEPFMQ